MNVTRVPTLASIIIFPVKSLDGLSVRQARLMTGGALEHDREYAIYDAHGKLVNGKRTSQVHRLRSSYDLGAGTITLRVEGEGRERTFRLVRERAELEAWLSGYFGFRVRLKHIPAGLPDHGDMPGPTVVSKASLEQVSTWFNAVNVEEARGRFRANLEVSDTPAFWEDGLVGGPKTSVAFRVGEARLEGVQPCERCVVPSRDPLTGEAYRKFQRTLATKRKESMPPWADLSSFPHFYYFCVLTRVAASEAGKVLRVGDVVEVLGAGETAQGIIRAALR